MAWSSASVAWSADEWQDGEESWWEDDGSGWGAKDRGSECAQAAANSQPQKDHRIKVEAPVTAEMKVLCKVKMVRQHAQKFKCLRVDCEYSRQLSCFFSMVIMVMQLLLSLLCRVCCHW